jgi:hypothetical protein
MLAACLAGSCSSPACFWRPAMLAGSNGTEVTTVREAATAIQVNKPVGPEKPGRAIEETGDRVAIHPT